MRHLPGYEAWSFLGVVVGSALDGDGGDYPSGLPMTAFVSRIDRVRWVTTPPIY